MTEKFEVVYKPIPGVGETLGIYHKYLIYTNSAGEQFYARGGPADSIDYSSGNPFVKLETVSGEYVPGTKDYDGSLDNPNLTPHPRETISTGDDLSEKWETIIIGDRPLFCGNI